MFALMDLARARSSLTLTRQGYLCALYTFIFVLVVLCVVVHVLFGFKGDAAKKSDKTVKRVQKRLAWALSCFNSGLLTALGLVYLYYQHQDTGLYPGKDVLQSRNDFSQLTSLWFALFNLCDLVFGSIYYRKQMDPLTAYVHHPLFIYIMFACSGAWGLDETGILSFGAKPFSSAFCLVCIEELPTFILALGSMFPSLRSDMGFGVSFFILRIVYHFFIMARGIFVKVHPVQTAMYGLTFIMHLFWFHGWVTGMKKKKGEKGEKGL
jgi:hypothetical protein